ncbi:MAG: hydroxymethylglutaryl-CoA lyase [Pseudomonadota bacterium]
MVEDAPRTPDVVLFEAAPRDGLQNEKRAIPTADKVRLVDLLAETGLKRIEAASFVSPKWVPQMADGAQVMAGIRRVPGVQFAALTPNPRGVEAAIAAEADEVSIFASASEGFSKANLNRSVAESLAMFAPVAARAVDIGLPVRGYVSCVTDCPYDGPVAPQVVARVCEALFALGCFEISLGDTIGAGAPETVGRMLEAVFQAAPPEKLAGHFHDTGGRAVENAGVALDLGLRVLDGCAGGLGGCPYAPGAAGNVDTRKLLALCEARGLSTGVDAAKLEAASAFALGLRAPAEETQREENTDV